jgi:hypothetical protein
MEPVNVHEVIAALVPWAELALGLFATVGILAALLLLRMTARRG